MSDPQLGYRGAADANSFQGDFNKTAFLMWQVLNGISTVKLVQVVAVTNAGDLSPVGFVDVQPLVNQLDGFDNAVDHGVIHNLPYSRLQGGTDAVILDPKVGDIGMAGFCDRDISSVKVSKAQANPGSKRKFDMADGLYIGGFLNGTPQQYVRFFSGGMELVSPTKVRIAAPLVQVDASTSFTVNSPQSGFSGAVIVQGLLSFLAGMSGSIASGVAAVITGAVQFIGSITSNGKAIDSTHTHHENGAGSNTNPPN